VSLVIPGSRGVWDACKLVGRNEVQRGFGEDVIEELFAENSVDQFSDVSPKGQLKMVLVAFSRYFTRQRRV